MSKTTLYVDGENIKNYIKTALRKEGVKEKDFNLENLSLTSLFKKPLKGVKISRTRYYSAKLRYHNKTPKKSKELILKQRVHKSNLEKQGIEFIIGGNVRAQELNVNGRKKIVFREKGVDVRIAVDLVADSCDKQIETAVLCSSDSDLQPAVKEAKERGVEVIYLGFEINPNKGLSYTTDRTILIRNSEVLEVHKEPARRPKK